MTREETKKVIAIMMAAYPNYKPSVALKETIDLWTVMLSEYPSEAVLRGMKEYIATDSKGFPPAIGQIISMIHKPERMSELNEMEAWALVSRAVRNGYYGAEDEFEKLPPLVQKAVGSPSQLRSWAVSESSAFENVIQSNFIKTYRSVCAREEEIRKTPADIRQIYLDIDNNIKKGISERTTGSGIQEVQRITGEVLGCLAK